jgi:hypothetical protein
MKHPMPAEEKWQKQKVSNSYSAVILAFLSTTFKLFK